MSIMVIDIPLVVGVEALKTVKEWILKRPKIKIKLCRHGINNYYIGHDEKNGIGVVEIILRFSNYGKVPVGISKIETISKNKDYFIVPTLYDYTQTSHGESIRKNIIDSFKLEMEETKLVCIHSKRNIYNKDKLEVDVNIYKTNGKIMKSMPISLYRSSQWGVPSKYIESL